MAGEPRGVVTVSRLYGAGGVSVAEAAAAALGFRAIDRELVERAARGLGIDPEVARGLDERAPGLIEEAGLALAVAQPGIELPVVEDRTLAEGVRRVIEALARAGGWVILGRGGQAALRGHPRTCHLQLVGDLEDRARRVAERHGVSYEVALEECLRADADRAAYVHRFYDTDIMDPLLYDAVLNTSRLGLDGATDVAVTVARSRLGAAR